ncbi:MAG: DNA translocase FtsK [Eubacterium sp.]|nr:DNA translocase FtsK [Eubacterium sp.]
MQSEVSVAAKKNTAGRSAAQNHQKKTSTKRETGGIRSRIIDDTEENHLSPERQKEIKFFVFLAVSIFMLCSNFGICGAVGNVFSGFFFGLIGWSQYLIPFYLFFAAAFLLSNGPKKSVLKKIIWVGAILILTSWVFQLIAGTEEQTFSSIFDMGYTDHRGGGVIFGGILVLLSKLIGKVGVIILTVLLSIVAVIQVTGFSIVNAVKSIFSFNYHDVEVDDGEDDYEELREEPRFVPSRRRKPARLEDLKVLPEEEPVEEPDQEPKRKRRNLPKEEMQELIPDPYLDDPKDFFALKPQYDDPLDGIGSVTVEAEAGAFPEPAGISRETAESVTTGEVKLSGSKKPGKAEPLIIDDTVSEYDEAPVKEEKVTHADTLREMNEIEQKMEEPKAPPKKPYRIPPFSLLTPVKKKSSKGDADVRETAMKLKATMESFGVRVTITDYSRGPAVTRYEMTPESGVKVSRILALQDDIKLNLAAPDIRIEAPIPGKSAIGIEVPNKENQMVSFRELVDNDTFRDAKSKLSFAIGKDIGGQLVIGDIAKMPHILIAGSTGSGKSVCINTIIMSILYKAKPDEVRMIMVDPKMVELTAYNGIPHMLIPVVTDPKKAAGALNWAVQEMERRYKLFARYNVRNLEGFNKKAEEEGDPEDLSKADLRFQPQIVVIVDELADLMMVAHGEVEDAIVRLSQLARAAGIHLVIATQRPSVDVITGLIKANVPSRIAFAVSSGTDSRTILDMVGAEKLLGKGDMLYFPTGLPKPVRVQGAFVSDDEVMAVTDYIKNQCGDTEYDENIAQSIEAGAAVGSAEASGSEEEGERYDEYFEEAGRLVIEKDKASIGYLQRVFRIGFNRAARIMDQLADAGVVGPEEGTKPRKILMTMDQFEEFMSL